MSMKEIVTKAIIGKSKKDYKNTYTVEVEKYGLKLLLNTKIA